MYGQMTGMRQIKQLIICINIYKEMFVFTSGAFLQLYLLQFICHAWLVKQNDFICCQMDSGQGDLGTLANVVTSLASLSDSLRENLNNGDTSDGQRDEHSASDITRLECST